MKVLIYLYFPTLTFYIYDKYPQIYLYLMIACIKKLFLYEVEVDKKLMHNLDEGKIWEIMEEYE